MTNIQRLTEKRDAYASAFGAEHHYVRTIDSSIAAGDESYAASTLDLLERTTPPADKALVAVKRNVHSALAKETPFLWYCVDVAAPPGPLDSHPDATKQWVRGGVHVRGKVEYRLEQPEVFSDRVIARMLFPVTEPTMSIDPRFAEEAARAIRENGCSLALPMPPVFRASRDALLAAALEVNSTKGAR